MTSVDVIVVGGGPVGLAAAIEARLAGLDVLVVEPRSDPVDKACGEGLMPGSVGALAAWGVHPDGRQLTGIRYLDARREVTHRFATGTGLGVRRTALRAALADRAHEVGVRTVRGRGEQVLADDARPGPPGAGGAPVVEIVGPGVPDGLSAPWVLACDGLHSGLRRQLGLERAPARWHARRYGLRRHFRVEPWADVVEVHWAPRHELYVTPVADDVVGIAVLGPRGATFDDAVREVPAVARRLAGAAPASTLRGAGPLRQRSTAVAAGRVLLVGDASGYVDALTGEGLRVGFAQARAAVACVLAAGRGLDGVRETGDAYGRAWSTVTRDYRTLTGSLVAAAASPLRGAVVPLAVAAPRLFSGAVERLAR